jgi:hypothetical protein
MSYTILYNYACCIAHWTNWVFHFVDRLKPPAIYIIYRWVFWQLAYFNTSKMWSPNPSSLIFGCIYILITIFKSWGKYKYNYCLFCPIWDHIGGSACPEGPEGLGWSSPLNVRLLYKWSVTWLVGWNMSFVQPFLGSNRCSRGWNHQSTTIGYN